MHKDLKILSEVYDQIVKNNFDIKHKDAMPGGGLKTENSPGGLVKMEDNELSPPYDKNPDVRAFFSIYFEGEEGPELDKKFKILYDKLQLLKKELPWLDFEQQYDLVDEG